MSKNTEIAVIGAGAVGSAVAYFTAKTGLKVTLIDSGDIASFTSSHCDGNVLACDKEPGLDASLTMRSQDLLDGLSEELEYDFEWERRGSMYLMETEYEMEMGRQLMERFHAINMRCHMMDYRELHEAEPYVAEDIVGGMWFDDDGCLSPMGLCYALANGIKKFGGTLMLHTTVTGLEKDGDGFKIHTDKGEDVLADCVVDCCGVYAPKIGAMLGVDIPIRPRQGQILVAEQCFKIAKQKVQEFGYIMAKFQNAGDYKRNITPAMEKYGIALVYEPTGGNNFLLGSSRYFTEAEDIASEIEIMQALAERGCRFFPVMKDIKCIRSYAGVRPFTPDHMPIISDTDVPGFYVAAGHEGDGIGLSSVTGLLMSQMLNHQETEFEMTALDIRRFGK